jgi:hypothetical protein
VNEEMLLKVIIIGEFVRSGQNGIKKGFPEIEVFLSETQKERCA